MIHKDLYELLEISPYSSREEVKDALTSYIKIPGIKSTKKFRQIGEELNLFLLLGQDLYNSKIKFNKENEELTEMLYNNSLKYSPATRKNLKIGEFSLEIEESIKKHRKGKKTKFFPSLLKKIKKVNKSYISTVLTYFDKDDTMKKDFNGKTNY